MYKKIVEEDISIHSGIPKQYYHLKNKNFDEWEIPPWEVYIDSNKLLGEGTWAKVYLAEWRQTTVVAKVLKNTFDNHAKMLIINEFKNMTKMHHPNIVQLFGYVEEPFVIVMEYFKNGDLFQNLKKLKLNQKIKITNDILKGLIYIHNRKPCSLIHRDIKLKNILLTNSYTAKIADFGLSTLSIGNIIKIASNNNLISLENQQNTKTEELNENNEYTDYVGTERYMAPEVKTKYYNNKVDIYSCGILLYELYSSNIYMYKLNWNNSNISDKLKNLILNMIDENPENRPNASYALNNFKYIKFNNYKNLLYNLVK